MTGPARGVAAGPRRAAWAARCAAALPIALAPAAASTEDPAAPAPGVLERLAAEPALLQLVALAIVAGIARVVWLRLSRRAAVALERRALADYLTAVEQVLGGEWQDAADRLDAVVERDPRHREARLLRALAWTDAGRPADAHREHVGLRAAYGLDAGVNERGLARALLDAGRPREAADALDALLRRHPDDHAARRLLVRAAHAAARPEVAVAAARALHERRAPLDPELREVARVALRAWAVTSIAAADPAGVGAVTETATKGPLRDPALALRIAAHRALHDGRERAVERLLEPSGDVSPVAAVWSAGRRVDHPLAVLAADPDPGLCAPLLGGSRLADALEANAVHVGRLADTVAAVDDRDASDELLRLVRDAAEIRALVFERAVHCIDPAGATRLLAVLAPAAAPTIAEQVADWARRDPERRTAAAARLGELAARADARVADAALLSAAWPELRRIAIDGAIRRGDLGGIDRALDACSPLEVLERLDSADDEPLAAFLAGVPAGHVLLDVLLADAAFSRDAALVDAALRVDAERRATDARALDDLLVRRGDARAIVRRAAPQLADPERGPRAARLLDRLGANAIEHLVAAFAATELPAAAREQIGARLAAAGPAVVGRLCELFGSTPSPLDDAVVGVLARIGAAAIEPLRQAWRSGPLLSRLTSGGRERRAHRRLMVVRALGRIGGPRAVAALEELETGEPDGGVRLTVAQVLHRLGRRLGGHDTPGGPRA